MTLTAGPSDLAVGQTAVPAHGPAGALPPCVVLCGGLGTRLAATVTDRPKVLAEVSGRPFIEWVLLGLRANGFTDILLATGHRADQVEGLLADGGHLGVRLRYSSEEQPQGTGGALRRAMDAIEADRVLAVNGDTYADIPVRQLLALHERSRSEVTALAGQVPDRARYGAVELDEAGRVVSFGEKGQSGPGLVSLGVYVINRTALERFGASERFDLETTVLPKLTDGRMSALPVDAEFIDMGTPESLAGASDVIERIALPRLRRSPGDPLAHVRQHLRDSAEGMLRVADECGDAVVAAGQLVADAFSDGQKLLLCGNGGSAADCQHVAAEFVSRLDRAFDRASLPAIALTTDSSFLTAFANDVSFEGVFARQVEGLGQPGDVLLGISTSGGSRNVRLAIEAARRRHMKVIGLFGAGAPLADAVDVAIVLPTTLTQTTQECMLAVEHSICEIVEQIMFGAPDLLTSRKGRQ